MACLQHSIKRVAQLWSKASPVTPKKAECLVESYSTLLCRNALVGRLVGPGSDGTLAYQHVNNLEKNEVRIPCPIYRYPVNVFLAHPSPYK